MGTSSTKDGSRINFAVCLLAVLLRTGRVGEGCFCVYVMLATEINSELI
jgi:hypothetical protein